MGGGRGESGSMRWGGDKDERKMREVVLKAGGRRGGGGAEGVGVERRPWRSDCSRMGIEGRVSSCMVRGGIRCPVVNELGKKRGSCSNGGAVVGCVFGRGGAVAEAWLGINVLHRSPTRAAAGCNGSFEKTKPQCNAIYEIFPGEKGPSLNRGTRWRRRQTMHQKSCSAGIAAHPVSPPVVGEHPRRFPTFRPFWPRRLGSLGGAALCRRDLQTGRGDREGGGLARRGPMHHPRRRHAP